MDALHQLEILWITAVQALGGWLSEPMRLFSLLGNEEFYLLVMPVLYWSVDARLGFRVAIMLLLSNGFSAFFKVLFHSPRPYWIDPRVRAFSVEPSFGIPSGHAQNAASIWGLVTAEARGRGAKIFLILLIFLIGLSRIYLGVHFVSDVLLGWLLGGLLLWGFLRAERLLSAWLRSQSLPQMLALAVLSSLLLGAVMLLPALTLRDWQVPEAWERTALAANPESEIDPLNPDGAFTVSGTWLGMMAGVAWMYHRRGGFQVSRAPRQRVLCYLIGLIGIFFFWYALGGVFPRGDDLLSYSLRFLRYTLVGLWVSALAPLLFQRLGLNEPAQAARASLSQ